MAGPRSRRSTLRRAGQQNVSVRPAAITDPGAPQRRQAPTSLREFACPCQGKQLSVHAFHHWARILLHRQAVSHRHLVRRAGAVAIRGVAGLPASAPAHARQLRAAARRRRHSARSAAHKLRHQQCVTSPGPQ
jgi:hypothetical protein